MAKDHSDWIVFDDAVELLMRSKTCCRSAAEHVLRRAVNNVEIQSRDSVLVDPPWAVRHVGGHEISYSEPSARKLLWQSGLLLWLQRDQGAKLDPRGIDRAISRSKKPRATPVRDAIIEAIIALWPHYPKGFSGIRTSDRNKKIREWLGTNNKSFPRYEDSLYRTINRAIKYLGNQHELWPDNQGKGRAA